MKKKKYTKKKLKKYSYGGQIINPSDTMFDVKKDMAEYKFDAENSIEAMLTEMIGGVIVSGISGLGGKVGKPKKDNQFSDMLADNKATDYSLPNMDTSGISLSDTSANWMNASEYFDVNIDSFKYGGKTEPREIEVEGGESYKTASGEVGKFKGAEHEQGGIPVEVNEPIKIFSKEIKIDGETVADRNIRRQKELEKLKRITDKNPKDNLSKNALERRALAIQKEEEADLQKQEIVKQLLGSQSDKVGLTAEYGLWDDFFGTREDGTLGVGSKFAAGMQNNLGNIMGFYGNYKTVKDRMDNLEEMRSQDEKHINYYEDANKDAINTLEASKDNLAEIRTNENRAIEDEVRANQVTNRTTARGINQMKSTDLATYGKGLDAKNKIAADFAKLNLDIDTRISDKQAAADALRMKGATDANTADERARDAYYTAKDKLSYGDVMQQNAKDYNTVRQQQISKTIIDQLSKYGITFDSNFNLTSPGTTPKKEGIKPINTKKRIETLSEFSDKLANPTKKLLRQIVNNTETYYEDGKFYNAITGDELSVSELYNMMKK